MVEHGIKGRIVFVSSAIGLFSFAGYSAYSPAKYAIRGESASEMVFALSMQADVQSPLQASPMRYATSS